MVYRSYLIELDYPRRTAQTDEIKAQNNQLQQMFGVKGYPAVHFVNVEKLDNGKMNLYSLGKQVMFVVDQTNG